MSKKIFIAIPVLLLAGILSSFIFPGFFPVSADDSANTTFQVNIQESLSVSITTPTSWATGDIDTFLRNTVGLEVSSNNANGFTASMSMQNSTNLTHSSKAGVVLNTLASSSTRSSFPANRWGYSLSNANFSGNETTYGETNAGNASSSYYPLTTSAAPITILKNTTSGTLSQSIYFGAKSDITKASGTYSGTVVINVVSGIINNDSSSQDYNPITPTNPATDVRPDGSVTDATNHRIVSTTTTSRESTNTTTTTVNEYIPPQGVTDSTSSNVYEGSMLTTALAATAGVAAASGLTFFILAKRKKDDDEDEEETI